MSEKPMSSTRIRTMLGFFAGSAPRDDKPNAQPTSRNTTTFVQIRDIAALRWDSKDYKPRAEAASDAPDHSPRRVAPPHQPDAWEYLSMTFRDPRVYPLGFSMTFNVTCLLC